MEIAKSCNRLAATLITGAFRFVHATNLAHICTFLNGKHGLSPYLNSVLNTLHHMSLKAKAGH